MDKKKKLPLNKDSPFTNNDYNSGDGMMTSVWGPATWLLLHTMSFNYPVEPSEDQIHKPFSVFSL